jgi:hypothetical protein
VNLDEDRMRRAAAVAARVLVDLWPDGSAVISIDDLGPLHFVVSAERDGVRVQRTGEAMGRELWDVIEMGEAHIFQLPSGARRVSKGVVSVGLPRRRFRRPRPVHWAEEEVEELCKGLNAIDAVVLGTEESFCRVCGFDDELESERYFVGEPQYIVCPCCGSESGVDDLRPEMVRQARRAWVGSGRMWREPEERPADWDPDAALAALPARWRDL